MTTYRVPYTFVPGTKAKATEVNANFSSVMDLIEETNNNSADINLSNITETAKTVILNNSRTSRELGEIVASTLPITDSNLHLLDGAVIDGVGIYSAFVDYISNLDNTANYFCTEAEWQESVTDYGVCGKFVYDSTNNTVRLPKITGFTESTIDATTLGDITEAGLPNITGALLGSGDRGTYNAGESGALSYSQTNITYSQPGSVGGASGGVEIDASLSNSIYGNSSTVQPQSIKVLYYIVVATSTKTNIQVDIDEIATDLNGKMDTDLSNMSASSSAKSTITSWGIPDYSSAISLSSSSFPYTATAKGIVYCHGTANNTNFSMAVNNVTIVSHQATNSFYQRSGWVLVDTGDVVTYSGTSFENATFIPLKGVA